MGKKQCKSISEKVNKKKKNIGKNSHKNARRCNRNGERIHIQTIDNNIKTMCENSTIDKKIKQINHNGVVR